MKKQLTGLLALLMGFACFAGCGGGGGKDDSTDAPGSSVETPAYELEAAKQAIYGLYPTKAEGREDYELPNSFEVNGVVYTLAWSTNATADDGIELDVGTETTYVNVNTGLAADVDYNLTAKLTAPDGTSIDIPFKRTLKAAPTAVIGTITQNPAADQAYKLYMYQSLKKYDLFFTGKMSGFYLATTNSSNGETYVDGVDVYAVAVDGKDGVYNLSFTSPEDSTTQYIGVKNTYNNGSWHDNAIYANSTVVAENEVATFEFTYNATYGTMVATLDNVKSGETKDVEGTTETFFLGTSNTYYTFGAMNVKDINKENTYVGKLATMIEKSTIDVEEKLTFTGLELDVQTNYAGNSFVRLPDQGERYPEVSIAWSLTTDSTNFVLNGTKLTITEPASSATAKLTATLTCGETTKTVDFDLSAIKVLTSPADIVDAAYALEAGEALPIAYTLTGVITKIDSAYSSSYNNVSVIIAVEGKEDKPILCFRMKGEGADVIKVGDTITATGILKNYNGKIEFDAGCTLDSYTPGEVTPPAGGEDPDTPVVDPNLPVMDEATAYKFYLVQVTAGKTLYVDGGVSGRYLSMTETASEGADVYAEKATGGYKFYILVDGAKNYINIYMNAESKVSVNYTADSTCVYAYNADSNCWYTNVDGTDYYLGTYNTFETVSASKTSFINAENTGVSQFPAVFITKAEAESTTPPAGGEDPDTPVVDPNLPVMDEATAYKLYLVQVTAGKTLYVDGGVSGRYLSMTETASEGADVYAEKATGGYKFYILVDGAKNYINIYMNAESKVSVNYTADSTCVYAYNADSNCWYTNVDGTDYYLGTYNTFETVSASKTSFINAENTGVSQFPAVFITKAEAESTTPPAGGEGGEVTPPAGGEDPDTPVVNTNKADFETFDTKETTTNIGANSKYQTYNTVNGWVAENSALQAGGATDMNPNFTVLGADNSSKGVCLNGKTSAAGKLTSPTIAGGIAVLKFKHTNMFTDTAFAFTVTITAADGTTVSKSFTRDNADKTKYVVTEETWVLETAISGEFTIVFVNDCPSNLDSNKDRVTIWDINWSATVEGGEVTPPAGGEDPDTPVVDPNLPVMDEATAYKFYLEQNNKGVTYYFTGAISGNFLSTTIDPAEAVDVYVEKAESGYSFYFTVESTKTYININESGKAALATENPTVYSYNAEKKIWWTTVANTDYYLGTYNNYTTIGSSATSYITVENTGVSQFPAAFIVATEAKAPTAAEKVAFEKAKLIVANTATGAATIELPSIYTIYSDVTITWALTESAIATLENNVLTITNPDEETKVTVTATITCGDATETAVFEIVVSHKEEGTVTTTVFEFGNNGATGHVDGNDIGKSKSYTSGAYTLTLTDVSKVYDGAKDEKGTSALKLGTSSVVGTFTFTVADDVTEVIFKVAKYKAKTTKVTINGTQYTINTSSNDGAYTEIKIDTTTTKTITFATVSGACRAMIDSITFIS